MIKNLWWLVIICALIAFTVSLTISLSTTPLYRARATFIVAPNPNLTSSRDLMTSLDTLNNASIISTYADILRSNRIFDEGARELQLNVKDLKDYRQQVNLKVDSTILELEVEGPDPNISTALANSMGKNGIIYIKGIYQVFDINFLDQATPPVKPFYPTPLRDGGIASGIGLLVGIILTVISETIRIPLEALRQRSITDMTTLAFTESYFRRRVEQEVARNLTDPMSLALIDLKGLRELIDVLPEPVLTRTLRKITSMLHNKLYGTDVIGRWNKSGYAILLSGTPGKAALRTMERIRQTICEPIEIEPDETIDLLPCIGLISRRRDDETAADLIKNAEAALAKASQSTDNTTIIYGGE